MKLWKGDLLVGIFKITQGVLISTIKVKIADFRNFQGKIVIHGLNLTRKITKDLFRIT